jgi:hypothetical protein
VILYGSRARGDWTEDSDYDLLAIRSSGPKRRWTGKYLGAELDAFILSEAEYKKDRAREEKVAGGKVLLQKNRLGDQILRYSNALSKRKPPKLPRDEMELRRNWSQKMLTRSARNDFEGAFRAVWLKFSLLEDYFEVRRLKYQGPKKAGNWLKENDPTTLRLFEKALKSQKISDLAKLVSRVHKT